MCCNNAQCAGCTVVFPWSKNSPVVAAKYHQYAIVFRGIIRIATIYLKVTFYSGNLYPKLYLNSLTFIHDNLIPTGEKFFVLIKTSIKRICINDKAFNAAQYVRIESFFYSDCYTWHVCTAQAFSYHHQLVV